MNEALIVVDVQPDFCEGGSLAVEGGNKVAEDIAEYIKDKGFRYKTIVFTADWHSPVGDNDGHFSAEPDFVKSWPPHCIAGTPGAMLHPALIDLPEVGEDNVFQKGFGKADYSGFQGRNAYGQRLRDYLTSKDIDVVDVCGIAGDYCVKETALSAVDYRLAPRILDWLVVSVRGKAATQRAKAEVAGRTLDKDIRGMLD